MSFFSAPEDPRQKSAPLRLHVDDPLAQENFSLGFQHTLFQLSPVFQQPKVLVCIGTDRSTGDCLGPLIGSKLAEKNVAGLHIFGDLENPVHASNLEDYLQKIASLWSNPCIIAIDACLGRLDSVGYINLAKGSLKPGAGVNKKLPPVGHFHITGIVNVGGFMEYFVLQNTRLSMVMKMAKLISSGIADGLERYIQKTRTE